MYLPAGFPSDGAWRPLPEHCRPVNELLYYISATLGTCIPTPLALISSTLGTLSIISWLFAQLPQIFKNYSVKSTSGLSIYFLAEWCAGDVSNLLGAYLTRQATWQVVVASYYVIVDFILCWQYTWYSWLKPRQQHWRKQLGWGSDSDDDSLLSYEDDGEGSSEEAIANTQLAGSSTGRTQRTGYGSIPAEKTDRSSGEAPGRTKLMPSSTTLLAVSMLCALASAKPDQGVDPDPDFGWDRAETLGRILSWMSTFFYLGSRLPQLYKNHVRRSTAGLSPALFFAAFCGNLFYSSSLLTNPLGWYDFGPHGGHGWAGPDGSNRDEWAALATPFWLGAAGVLMLDAAVGFQFLIFGDGETCDAVEPQDIDRWGRRRRRVTGWMRGWLPSSNPATPSESENDGPDVEDRSLPRRSRKRRARRALPDYGSVN